MAELHILADGLNARWSFTPGARLTELLRSHGTDFPTPCGGRGKCGKCAVTLSGHLSPPSPMEEQLGVRLACQTRLLGDAEAVMPRTLPMEGIELGTEDRLPVPRPMPGALGAALDLGTTTLALSLYDLSTGNCLARCGMLNPQTSVAADVMGRIAYALEHGVESLRTSVRSAARALLARACGTCGTGPDAVQSMVVTGNTTMLTLFTGRDPAPLSRAPFRAEWLGDESLQEGETRLYLPPCMHAFVGADITCALLSSGVIREKGPALLVDAGTNGEMALWKEGELLVTSTAAGPAFEGAGISCGCGSVRGAIDRVWLEGGSFRVHVIGETRPIGLCGSGLRDAGAAGLEAGLVDETGSLECPMEIAPGVCLLPEDIRSLQLAKAAIAAGVETLLETAGIRAGDVRTFCLAGGFGRHLRPRSALRIGLFPPELMPLTRVIGNAALQGAERMLTDTACLDEAREIAGKARHVSLGGNPAFSGHYMDRMLFPPS